MKRHTVSIAVALCVAASLTAAEAPKGRIWLVVTRKMFVDDLKPLADRRRAKGFDVRISLLPPDKAVASLKQRPAYILLVGDDQLQGETEKWLLPAPRRKLYRWRSAQRKQFAAGDPTSAGGRTQTIESHPASMYNLSIRPAGASYRG